MTMCVLYLFASRVTLHTLPSRSMIPKRHCRPSNLWRGLRQDVAPSVTRRMWASAKPSRSFQMHVNFLQSTLTPRIRTHEWGLTYSTSCSLFLLQHEVFMETTVCLKHNRRSKNDLLLFWGTPNNPTFPCDGRRTPVSCHFLQRHWSCLNLNLVSSLSLLHCVVTYAHFGCICTQDSFPFYIHISIFILYFKYKYTQYFTYVSVRIYT